MKKILIALLALTMLTSVACTKNEDPAITDEPVTENITTEYNSDDITVETEVVTVASTVAETQKKKNNKKNKKETVETTEATTEATTQPTTKKSSEKKNNNKKPIKKAVATTVSTDYFDLVIPASWYDQYTYKIIDGKHIFIYHKKSKELGYSGIIFSVELFSVDEDYTVYPIHTYINTVETKNKEYYDVVAVYPSDTQCPKSLITDYTRFKNQAPSLLKTIKYSKKLKVVQ